MDEIGILGIICIAICVGILLVQADNEHEKELELIKNTKEYVIHQNCENFDGEWYCFD